MKKITKEELVSELSLSAEQARALGLSRTSVVRAGAGAGKTTTLVASLLYDLLVEEVPAEKIAVATFTRSAAASLRSRLEESLWRLFGERSFDLSSLWLGTIDALALRYLKLHALREGMDPAIKPARKRDLLRLAREAFDRVTKSGRFDDLMRAVGTEDDLFSELLAFELYLESGGIESIAVFEKPRLSKEPLLEALQELALSGVGEKSYQMIEKEAALVLGDDPESMKPESKWNIRKESAEFIRAQGLRKDWRQGEIDYKLLPLREGAEDLFKGWQLEYNSLRKEYGVFSYTDILTSALQIAEPRFSRIYIDEAQDTSVLQRKMLKALSDGETIFIGDKNQSIYHFRGADTSLWESETSNLPEVVLSDNYRSGKEILRFVEKACKPLLGDDLISMKGKRSGGQVKLFLTQEARLEEESSALTEARVLLPRVFQEIDPKYNYSDIAILLPANDDINQYKKALRELGIPALALRARGLLGEEECLDLKAYLHFLDDRENEKALLRLLSSPFFSRTREEIFHWSKRSKAEEKPLFSFLPKEERILLEEAILERDKIKPSELIRRAIRRHRFDLSLEILDPTGVMLDNVEGFLGILEEIEEEGSNFSRVLRTLDEEEKANDDGQDKDLPGGREAVRLLTIHRAKGDEFPVVILGRISKRKKYAKNRFLAEEGELGLSLPGGLRDSVAKKALDKETLLLQDETNRLFYVAATRARDQLFLLALYNGKKPGSPLLETGLASTGEKITREEKENYSDEILLKEDHAINIPQDLYSDKRVPQAISWSRLSAWDECSLRRDLELFSFSGSKKEGGGGKRFLGEKIHRLLGEELLEINPERYPKEAQEMIKSLKKSPFIKEARAWEKARGEVSFLFQVEGIPLRGRIDLLLEEGDKAWIIDWKSGEDDHFEKAYLLQRQIYALSMLLSGKERVRATTYYLRDGKMAEETYSNKEELSAKVSQKVQDILQRPPQASSKTEKPFCAGCPGLIQICPVSKERKLEIAKEAKRSEEEGS